MRIHSLWNCHLILAAACIIPAAAIAQDVSVAPDFAQLDSIGSATLEQGPLAALPATLDRSLEVSRLNVDALTQLPRIAAAAARTALAFPTVPNTNIVSPNPNVFGFDGLDHADQRTAGTGAYANTQFSTEPPDQGFCIGNGFAVETVNTALAIYRARNGALLSGPTALSQFFGLAPEVVRSSPPIFGDFISDPRCHYDAATNRFFLTLLQISVDPKTGGLLPDSSVLIAVTQTGDPTGKWNRFRLHTTSNGVGCPCFGDQPLIGFDANGFYITTNAFQIQASGFSGAQIYAMSKFALAFGAPPPFVLHFALPARFDSDGGLDFSVHPASNTRGQEFAHFGTQYFLSSFNVTAVLENQIVVWALGNTAFLNFPPSPALKFRLRRKVIASEVYGVPPDAVQKIGTLPLGSLVDPNVTEMLATNEHRMQQVTFANGNLWSAVTTGLTSPGENGNIKAGIAWFSVGVDATDDFFQADVENQGYLAVANGAVFFPAVGVNSDNEVAIGFSIASPALFPSTGYVTLNHGGHHGKVHLAGIGVNSEDGFTGYPDAVSVPPPCIDLGNGKLLCEARWGDYGAAAVDENGSIWLAGEYIGPRPRTLLANWGTFITRLNPGDDNEQ
jgi:hypothetical protein